MLQKGEIDIALIKDEIYRTQMKKPMNHVLAEPAPYKMAYGASK